MGKTIKPPNNAPTHARHVRQKHSQMRMFFTISTTFQSLQTCTMETLCEYFISVINSFLLIMEFYFLAFVKANLHLIKRKANYRQDGVEQL